MPKAGDRPMSLRAIAEKNSPGTAVGTRFLIVACGMTHFAMSADVVRAIVEPESNVTDVLSTLGVTVPILDLAERLRMPPSTADRPRIIVCGRRGMQYAFRIDEIVGLHEVERGNVRPLLQHFIGPERYWLSGMFLFRQTVALIVNSDWLFSEDCLSVAAAGMAENEKDRSATPSSRQQIVLHDSRSNSNTFQLIELEEAADAEDLPWATF
jgi:chemotaxis signal transduction protein